MGYRWRSLVRGAEAMELQGAPWSIVHLDVRQDFHAPTTAAVRDAPHTYEYVQYTPECASAVPGQSAYPVSQWLCLLQDPFAKGRMEALLGDYFRLLPRVVARVPEPPSAARQD